jgi:hypothetical protein
MLLDFAATFFASATALLPIFAQDILHVGASGYGWLYAAPSIGSLLAGALMVRAPGDDALFISPISPISLSSLIG